MQSTRDDCLKFRLVKKNHNNFLQAAQKGKKYIQHLQWQRTCSAPSPTQFFWQQPWERLTILGGSTSPVFRPFMASVHHPTYGVPSKMQWHTLRVTLPQLLLMNPVHNQGSIAEKPSTKHACAKYSICWWQKSSHKALSYHARLTSCCISTPEAGAASFWPYSWPCL